VQTSRRFLNEPLCALKAHLFFQKPIESLFKFSKMQEKPSIHIHRPIGKKELKNARGLRINSANKKEESIS